MAFHTPVFGKKITAKSRQAIQYLKDNPTCTIPEACKKFDVDYGYVLRRLEKTKRAGRYCPICQQYLAHKRELVNVDQYTKEYSLYLSKLMDAVRAHGSSCTNEEILELVHNSLISGE